LRKKTDKIIGKTIDKSKLEIYYQEKFIYKLYCNSLAGRLYLNENKGIFWLSVYISVNGRKHVFAYSAENYNRDKILGNVMVIQFNSVQYTLATAICSLDNSEESCDSE